MPNKKIFYLGIVGFIVLSAVLFRFSFLNENSVTQKREAAPQQPAAQNGNDIAALPQADYSKILEKYKGRDVDRAASGEKIIALTFDGGGNSDGVDEILQVLSENQIKSTFFLTGQFIEKFPGAVLKIKKAGHEIANHTYSHKNFTSLNAKEAAEEINKMKTAAEKNGVAVAPFFRFPYGAHKKEDIALVNGLGYVSARWTVDSLGWQGRRDDRDARFVAERVTGKAAPGAIVLMHLGSATDGSKLDAEALPAIVKTLKEQGYQFVPLSELFAKSL